MGFKAPTKQWDKRHQHQCNMTSTDCADETTGANLTPEQQALISQWDYNSQPFTGMRKRKKKNNANPVPRKILI
jgi:hypothetical protein